MIQTILNYCQPIAVVAFLVSGICCLLLREWKIGSINLSLFVVNSLMFYGDKIFK